MPKTFFIPKVRELYSDSIHNWKHSEGQVSTSQGKLASTCSLQHKTI